MPTDKFKEFRTKMVACAKEMGVDLEIGTITYVDNSFSFSAKGYNGADGKREEFESYAYKKKVNPSWFGKKFKDPDDGRVWEITGILPRGRKYVIEITGTDGTKSRCTAGYPKGRFIGETNKPAGITQGGGVLV